MATTPSNYRESYAKYSRYFKNLAQTYGKQPVVRYSAELLFTLLAISFFAVFAIRPTVNTIAHLYADIKTQKEIEGKLTDKISNLKKAQVAYSREANRLVMLDEALPRGPAPEFFVQQLEGLAREDGVILESITVGKTPLYGKILEEQSKGNGGSFEASFLVKGDYKKIVTYLGDLESLRRILSLNSVTVGVNKKLGEKGVITLTVESEVAYYVGKK